MTHLKIELVSKAGLPHAGCLWEAAPAHAVVLNQPAHWLLYWGKSSNGAMLQKLSQSLFFCLMFLLMLVLNTFHTTDELQKSETKGDVSSPSPALY